MQPQLTREQLAYIDLIKFFSTILYLIYVFSFQYPSGAPHPSYTATSVNYRPTSTTTNMGGCLSSPKPSQQMPPPSAGIQGPVGLPPQNNPLSDNNIQLQMPSSPGASSTTGGIVYLLMSSGNQQYTVFPSYK